MATLTEETTVLHIKTMPKDLMRRLKVAAAEEDRTMGEVVQDAVERYLRTQKTQRS